MLVSVGNANKIELFQIHENHSELEKNIFLNSNVDNFIESPPEILGNALADIWLCLAKKYEENQLDLEERETVFTNIHSIIPKIKKLDAEKELIHQFFVSKIASFSEIERNCLIKFFKDTIKFDLENNYSCMKKYYFFSAFMKLFDTLNPINKSHDHQIVDKIVKELEDYSNDVTPQIVFDQIPGLAREDIFKDYKNTTAISKFFKINKIFEKSSEDAKDSCFYAKKLEFLREITNDEITIDSLNLKDYELDDYIKNKALDYINVKGMLPYNCEKILCGSDSPCGKKVIQALINWLGFDKTQQIKKLYLDVNVHDEFEDLNFIFPNLEELSFNIKYVSENELKLFFDNVYWFSNLKTLELVDISADILSLCLSILSTVKSPENLELVLNFVYVNNDEWSRKKCIEVFGNLPDIGHITKLTVIDAITHDKLTRYLNDEIQKIMFSKFVNVNSLDVRGHVNNIKNALVFKNLKELSFNNDKPCKIGKIISSIQFFTQLTHLSLNRCYNIERPIISPNLKHFYLNGKEMPLEKITENGVEGSSIYKPTRKPFYEIPPLHEIRYELISLFYPEYVYFIPSRATKIKQLASIALLGWGITSLMKLAWGQPSPSSLPISMPLGKVGMVAAGTFLTLAAGASAYYYKTHNIKSKASTSQRLKPNHVSAKSPLNIANLGDVPGSEGLTSPIRIRLRSESGR